MVTSIGIGIVALIIAVAFFFVARRVLRLAFKLALVGVLVILLVAGGGIGWWRGWFSSETKPQRPAPQSNQRSNSNRRPAAR